MNDVRAAVKAVNFAFATARAADAVKKSAIVLSMAVCGYVIYRRFYR